MIDFKQLAIKVFPWVIIFTLATTGDRYWNNGTLLGLAIGYVLISLAILTLNHYYTRNEKQWY